MILSYNLEAEDLYWLYIYPILKKKYLQIIIPILSLVIFFLWRYIAGFTMRQSATMTLFNSILALGIVYKSLLEYINEEFAKSSGLIGKYTLVLSNDGIKIETPVKIEFYPWNSIQEVENFRDYLIIVTDKMYILPQRCFKSEREILKFLRYIACRLEELIS